LDRFSWTTTRGQGGHAPRQEVGGKETGGKEAGGKEARRQEARRQEGRERNLKKLKPMVTSSSASTRWPTIGGM
jgi:hypothetical protein